MESLETWRTEALKSFAISKSGMQGAKMSEQGVRTHHRMAAEHGLWQAVRMTKQGLLTLSQWSEQHIRIGYAIVWVWCSRVSCGSPDKGARHMSSWGIRMELIRIALRASCHPGEGSLHLAHADRGRILHSSFHTGEEFCPDDIPPSQDISHPDERGGHFNFSGQTYPDLLIALTRRVFLLVYSVAMFS